MDSTQLSNTESQNLLASLKQDLMLYPQQFQTKTILINLSQYAKSENSAETFVESFKFATTENSMSFWGYHLSSQTAQVEKTLIKQGKYEPFKQVVEQLEGETWEELRKNDDIAREAFFKSVQ